MDTIQLLKKLVSIDSVFPNEQKISRFIEKYLVEKGFKVERVNSGKERDNIIATFGKSDKFLAFYGHMDTIPNDFLERGNPFQVKIKGDKAWGLGVEDMKGGITAILKASEYAIENKFPLKLIFVCDEENISKGAHDVVNSGKLSDIGFLISGESGHPPENAVKYNVCLGRKGRILFEITVKGKKAHAATPEKGINAVVQTSRLIESLGKIKFKKHSHLGKNELVIHSIHSETDAFSVPDKCILQISLLTVPGINSSHFIKQVRSLMLAKKINGEISLVKRETPYGESYEIDRKNHFFKQLEKEIFKKNNISPIYTPSVADENIFANRLKLPVISLGPLGGGGHTSEEWLDISSLKETEEVYKKIIKMYNRIYG